MYRFVLKYDALSSTSLHLFRFFILVFHLKQKHEEGQRLLHYLQQTNTALRTCTFIYIYSMRKIKLNAYNFEFLLKISVMGRNV